MRNALFYLLLAVGAASVDAVPTCAQVAFASIRGTVLDPARSPIPGVQVSVRNGETGSEFKVASNSKGYFALPGLPSGSYIVVAAKSGFVTLEVRISSLPHGIRVST